MPDVPVSDLDERQKKLVENARVALENGNWSYVGEACGHVLSAVPGCVEARRLQHAAQLREFESKNRLLAKAMGGLSSTPFIFSSVTKDPHKAFSNAEKILSSDPTSPSALKLLADAAMELDYPETAAFARTAVRRIMPDDSGNLLELGEAWLAAGRPGEALTAADDLLKLKPLDSAGQNLLRKAAIAQATSSGWGTRPGSAPAAGGQPAGEPATKAGELSEDELLRALGKALTLMAEEPGNMIHYRAIVDAYRGLGRLNEALAWVRKARATPTGGVDSSLEKQEDDINAALLDGQVRMAESALLASPEDPAVREKLNAAKRELASFRFFEARRDVERAPGDASRRQAFALLCLERGQVDEAIGHFKAAQKDPACRLQALVGLGRALKAKKNFEEAVAQFLVAKNEPGPMDDERKAAVYQLAECYEMMGRPEQAIAEYKAIYSEDVTYRDVVSRINAYFTK